jgi:hypothetical protein
MVRMLCSPQRPHLSTSSPRGRTLIHRQRCAQSPSDQHQRDILWISRPSSVDSDVACTRQGRRCVDQPLVVAVRSSPVRSRAMRSVRPNEQRLAGEHRGPLAASLVSLLGDFAAAGDLVSDAVLTELQLWPGRGRVGAAGRVVVHRGQTGAVWMCCAVGPATGTSSPSCGGRWRPSRTTGCG